MSSTNEKKAPKLADLPVEEQANDVKGGSMDGISYLASVTQLKANNANDAKKRG